MPSKSVRVYYVGEYDVVSGITVHAGNSEDEAHGLLETLAQGHINTHNVRVVRDSAGTRVYTSVAGALKQHIDAQIALW